MSQRRLPTLDLALAAALPVALAAPLAQAQIILPPIIIERPSNLVVEYFAGALPAQYDQLLPGQPKSAAFALAVGVQCGFNIFGPYEPVPYEIHLVQPGWWENFGFGWVYTPTTSVTLGTGAVPLESVHCVGETPGYQFVSFDLNAPAVRAWAMETTGAPADWHVELVVDPVGDAVTDPDANGIVWEDSNVAAPNYDVDDNSATWTPPAPLERIMSYSGQVKFGPVTAPATDLQADHGTVNCGGAAPVDLTGTTVSVTPAGDGSFGTMAMALTAPTCAGLSYSAAGDSFDLLVQSGGTALQRAEGTLGGFPVSIAIALDPGGIQPLDAIADLPGGHSVHRVDESVPFARPEPYGYPYMKFPRAEEMSLSDLGLVRYAGGGSGYLHIRGIPFSLRTTDWRLDSAGLNALTTAVHYNHNQPYDLRDARANIAPRSNDNRYWAAPGAIGQPLSVTLLGASVGGTLSFGGAVTSAHFPNVSTRFDGFEASVSNGRLSETRSGFSGGLRPVAFTLASACPECGATSGIKRSYSLQPASDWGATANGDLSIKVSELSNAGWGPAVLDGLATKAAFERIGESVGTTGVVVVPGHYLQGTEAAGRVVADYLLAAFDVGDVAGAARVSNVRLLGEAGGSKGNGFYAGLTVGPGELVAADGQPDQGYGSNLAGTRTRIAFGGPAGAGGTPPTFGEIESNKGTKLVVRPGGVTGTFNTTTTGASLPQPQVYGYNMAFDRFAFRMVANSMDKISWVDGHVTLPGRSGFGVGFESMQILCSGDLGGGLLDADESRRKRLVAWKAPYDLRGVGFAPPAGAGACDDGDRVFETVGGVTVAALREPVDLTTQWYTNGEPAAASVTGKTQNEIDRATGDKRGFLVELAPSGVTMGGIPFDTNIGWFGFAGKVLVPFWKAPAAYMRAENKLGAGDTVVAGPTLVFKDGVPLEAEWLTKTNEQVKALATYKSADSDGGARRLAAAYDWGSTGFGFNLPILWNDSRKADEQAGFTGREITKKLFVLDAKAGVQYVTPDRTRLNFGASADFQKLAGAQISLNIDLSDPNSVQQVEDFLKIPGKQLSGWVNTIREPATALLKAVGIGTDGFVKKRLHEFLSQGQIGGVNVEGLFNSLAAELSKAQALPAQVVKGVFGQIRKGVDEALGALTAPLDTAARDTYRAFPNLIGAAFDQFDAGSAAVDAGTHEALTVVHTALTQVQAGVNSVAGAGGKGLDAVQGVLSEASAALAAVKIQADKVLGDALTAIDAVLGSLNDVANNPILACREVDEVVLSRVANPILSALKTIQEFAGTVAGALTNNTVGKIAIAVATFVGIDPKPIQNAQETIGAAAKKVEELVAKARSDVRGLLCGAGGGVTAVLSKAVAFLGQVRTPIFTLKSSLDTVFANLNTKLAAAVLELKTIRTTVQQVATAVNKSVDVLDAALVEGAAAAGDAKLALLDALELPPEATRADAEAKARAMLNQTAALLAVGSGPAPAWCETQPADPTRCAVDGRTIITELAESVRKPAHMLISYAETTISAELDSIVKKVPFPTGDEMRTYVVNLIMNSPVVEAMEQIFHENYVLVTSKLNELAGQAFDLLNGFLKAAVQQLVAKLNEALAAATSAITNNIPVKAAKIDGFAIVAGNELERMHIQADFTMNEKKKDSESKFGAALDIVSWSANGKAACLDPSSPVSASGVVDATISAYGIPLAVGPGDLSARKIYLGFTLEGTSPVGFAGGLITDGALKFKAFTLRDIQFHCGVGKYETYLGAKASAQFEGTDVQAAFLVGKTCNDHPLRDLDPEVANFIPLPDGKFEGVYIRGSASIPIWNVGCFLLVGAGADVGVWVLGGSEGAAVGGLVGGSVFGKALCLVSLRGGVRLLGNYYAGNFKFQGTGYGVGGFGLDCNPETWTSVDRSRDDDWCATGDAQFTATYDNGFNLGSPEVSGIH